MFLHLKQELMISLCHHVLHPSLPSSGFDYMNVQFIECLFEVWVEFSSTYESVVCTIESFQDLFDYNEHLLNVRFVVLCGVDGKYDAVYSADHRSTFTFGRRRRRNGFYLQQWCHGEMKLQLVQCQCDDAGGPSKKVSDNVHVPGRKRLCLYRKSIPWIESRISPIKSPNLKQHRDSPIYSDATVRTLRNASCPRRRLSHQGVNLRIHLLGRTQVKSQPSHYLQNQPSVNFLNDIILCLRRRTSFF